MATFKKRAGTTSLGTEFEDIHIANFVLQLVSNPQIEDFHLSSNDEKYGAFDDIVVEVNYASSKEIYSLQLKYKDTQTLTLNYLTQNKKEDFAIAKYFNSFQECKSTAQKFILFTNAKFQVKDNQPFKLESEDFNVTLSRFYPNDVFKISDKTNYCYKFNIVDDASTSQNFARIQQYKTFFDVFFLYVDQNNVYNLKVSIEKKFRKMFHSNKVEFETYLHMISEWSKRKGEKEKLNKTWMQRAIATLLLSSRIQPLSFAKVNENRKILRRAISDFDITVFEENSYAKVSELWGDAKEEIKDLKEINRMRSNYQLSSTYMFNLDNVDPKLLSQLLWIMGKCPLIVTEDQTVYKAIKLCLKDKFIVLGKGLIKKWQKHFAVFQDLSDLEKQSNVYKDLTKNFSFSLQGKAAMSLKVLFKHNQNVLNFITTNDLLEMLDGPCNIGSEKEDLPNPYIGRFLLRNVIDIRYVEKINEGTLIILNCGDKLEDLKRKLRHHKFLDIDAYLNEDIEGDLHHNKNIKSKNLKLGHVTNLKMDFEKSGFASTVYISKDECNLNKFQATNNKNKKAKNCHQFRYRDDGNLDWIRSTNDVRDLENYKVFNDFVGEKVLWSSQPDNNINVIIGDPGMGKTELMKSLKNNCSSGFWTVVVYPKDVYSFFKHLKNRNNIAEAFETFISSLKSENFKPLEQEIFKISIQQNTVVYVWDALDEISSDHLNDLTHIILQLSKRSVLQWVTSRQHLKKFLETRFNVLSITINQFNEDEQKFYIKTRLADICSKDECEQVVNKIQSSFTLVEHKDVLGIPLQIFMFAELFLQNKNKYLDLLNSVFALTDLYHYFIEEKTNIYFKEKAGVDPDNFQSHILVEEFKVRTAENYEKFALKALFPEEILRRLNINCETEQTNNSAIGIITEVTNGIPRFIHVSFAEYLVAVYFSKHLEWKDILVDIIFQQKYVNIRFFFDLLLAKTSSSHIAILYKDFDFLKKCANEILKHRDAFGRSVLHLACSWGRRYVPLNVQKSQNAYIIDDVNDFEVTAEEAEYLDMIEYLVNECDISANDTLLNMAPLSYAQKGECLFAKLKIIHKQNTLLSSADSASINILYYSARFGYSDALDLFIPEDLPFIKTKKDGHSLLHLAVGNKEFVLKLIEIDVYKKEIDCKDTDGKTSLHLAAYNNYHETAKILINNRARINAENRNGVTSLFMAAQNGHEKIVEILIKAGADINLAMNNGVTPLFIASQNGHESIVVILIESGADINATNDNGATPLFIASYEGHEKIVETLIKYKAYIDLSKKNGATPLLVACQEEHYGIVKMLIKSGADINLAKTDDDITPLLAASAMGREKIVELLLESGADFNLAGKNGATPLIFASFMGHEKIIKILIKVEANINLPMKDGVTPLFVASQSGHKEIVEFLIESGAKINIARNDGATPLFIASQKEHEKVVKILKKSGAKMFASTNDGATLLLTAALMGHEKIVEILLKSGAKITPTWTNEEAQLFVAFLLEHKRIAEILKKSEADINVWQNNNGATLLFMASQKGQVRAVDILIESGADINLADKNGDTPLFTASQKRFEKIVEILVKSGADINISNNKSATPLFVSSMKGYEKIVEILKQFGADINLANNVGATPLFIASKKGHAKIVEILIQFGADINLANNVGATPLFIASKKGHAKIVEMLIKSGAQN